MDELFCCLVFDQFTRPHTGNYKVDTARQILDSLVDKSDDHELDDLAVNFIEDDLGRHDWQ
jgi:hypothetical protein